MNIWNTENRTCNNISRIFLFLAGSPAFSMQPDFQVHRMHQLRLFRRRTHILTIGVRAILFGFHRSRHPHPVLKTPANALPAPVNASLLELKSQGLNDMISQHCDEQVRLDSPVQTMPDRTQPQLRLHASKSSFDLGQTPIVFYDPVIAPVGVGSAQHIAAGLIIGLLMLRTVGPSHSRGIDALLVFADLECVVLRHLRIFLLEPANSLVYLVHSFGAVFLGQSLMQFQQVLFKQLSFSGHDRLVAGLLVLAFDIKQRFFGLVIAVVVRQHFQSG